MASENIPTAPAEATPANGARPEGLSSEEARLRLERFGPNALPPAVRRGLWLDFIDQFRSPLIYVLLFALAFDLVAWLLEGANGLPVETVAIGLILLLNAALGMAQRGRAEQALERLKQLATPQVWTLRDGQLQRLPSPELVPGDVIRIAAGDRVPADGRSSEAQGLSLDESVLTGESVPVDRGNDETLLAGTMVTRGGSWLTLERTGSDSAMGRLAGMLGGLKPERTPLEVRLDRFGTRVAQAVALLASALVVLGVVLEGPAHFGEVFLFAVALAVAAVPEGLPAVITTTLALGTERMARRKAVVRQLAAVEALGSVTIIATDKTGTLTENRMRVETVASPDPERITRAMVFANDSEADGASADPLEAALYDHIRSLGLHPETLRADIPRLDGRPFDAAWRYMRATVLDEQPTSYLKGAPEVLLTRCQLDPHERQIWLDRVAEYGRGGARTLAFAWAPGEREHDLTFLGLVAFRDPLRPEVADAVRQVQEAGVRVLMLTGDHPDTAWAIAARAGIEPGRALSGADLDTMDDEQLGAALETASVLARVLPGHKLRVVEALKRSGAVVAVTGDGVNDAPALKRSHVGVAMGERGSDVTREVGSLVLLDDNFATIVAAIEEGRNIYTNIGKILRFLFATNLAEVVVVTLGILLAASLGLRDETGALLLPITAAQILWINLVTDALPALALTLDRNRSVMQRTPRGIEAPLLDRRALSFVVMAALLLSAPVLTTMYLGPAWGLSAAESRTTGFMILVLGQLALAYGARLTEGPQGFNPHLHGAIALCGGLQLLVLISPPLRTLLGVTPLPTPALLQALLTAVAVGLAGWLIGRRIQRMSRSSEEVG